MITKNEFKCRNYKSSKYIKFDGLLFKPELYKTLSLQFSVFSELNEENVTDEKVNNYNLQFIKKSINFSTEWKTFINYHTSKEFFNKLCDKFNMNKDVYKTCSIRNEESDKPTYIKVDFKVSFNPKNLSSKKEHIGVPHMYRPDKIFIILIYFPFIENKYLHKDNGSVLIYDRTVNIIDEINYEHNCGIIIKNEENSIFSQLKLNNHPDEYRRYVSITFIDNRDKESSTE